MPNGGLHLGYVDYDDDEPKRQRQGNRETDEMIVQSNQPAYQPCPLCGLYDFVEVNATEVLPTGETVSADLYCSDCAIQVSGPTLEEAIRKWNKLGEK